MNEIKVGWEEVLQKFDEPSVQEWRNLAALLRMRTREVMDLAIANGEYEQMNNRLKARQVLAKKRGIARKYIKLVRVIGHHPTDRELRFINHPFYMQVLQVFITLLELQKFAAEFEGTMPRST